MIDNSFYISTVCSATYGATALFIAIRARQFATIVLAMCCAVTSAWAALSSKTTAPMSNLVGTADAVRLVAWYLYLVYLYYRTGISPRRQLVAFTTVAIGVFFASVIISVGPTQEPSVTLFSVPIVSRLILSVSELLLIENMYLNLPEHDRWHVVIPCVLLGGIACFDILVAADTALIHSSSSAFLNARGVILTIMAPFLVLAAYRGRRWTEPVRLSRTAVFHSATLVLSGSVLVLLAGTGELVRRVNNEIGWIVELSLIASGLLGLCLFLSSRSARSAIQRVIVNHFYADRYDYRVQWLQCISTLSGIGTIERTTLSVRSIRAIADVVDSPSGSLFVIDRNSASLQWSGSWNMTTVTSLPSQASWVDQVLTSKSTVDLSGMDEHKHFSERVSSAWLAVPLLHNADVIGLVLIGHSRLPFRLDQEVLDLLKIVGREVGGYIAEQQANEAITQTQQLHDYSKRFAFVAHDIKNVASQLALLVNNAEHHLSNPDFQIDMVKTVKASVGKIEHLLKRLDQDSIEHSVSAFDAVGRLRATATSLGKARGIDVTFSANADIAQVSANVDTFDTIISHLLNNAIESGPKPHVSITLQRQADMVAIDITDTGRGMSADFVRDELFVPFKTNKAGGSGIGAYQARELLREMGGKLHVQSELGSGTQVRVMLPRHDSATPTRVPSLTEIEGGYA